MTDRPIIFSAPMVRALLREAEAPGTGKTQTRRVLRDQPIAHPSLGLPWLATRRITFRDEAEARRLLPEIAPYLPGDRLWVRENWWEVTAADGPQAVEGGHSRGRTGAFFRADHPDFPPCPHYRDRPSIHMPRWASRITLLVEAVRVERLQDISEADAIAEGIRQDRDGAKTFIGRKGPGRWVTPWPTAREAYEDLWTHLHGPDAWASNPWVAAITFRPVQGNIDSLGDRP
ncbi:MAG: hypothetical protein RLZZ501_273 [Pseudomonadota bacterium]|jgi:hypothetical protein